MTISSFLSPSDYLGHIEVEIFNKNRNLNDALKRQRIEQIAMSEMESYLANRYDMQKVFKPIPEWQKSKQYKADEKVQHRGKYFIALQTVSLREPATVSADKFWKQNEPRSVILISKLIDMVLYQASVSEAINLVPELRLERYDNAISWLKEARNGTITLNLPIPEAKGEHIDAVILGSNPKYSSNF